MAQAKNITGLTELLLKCMAEPDPMLSMLEWLCAQLMEAEVSGLFGAEKNAQNPSRSGYAADTGPGDWIPVWERMISWYPSSESRGHIFFFVTERKRSEMALIQDDKGSARPGAGILQPFPARISLSGTLDRRPV